MFTNKTILSLTAAMTLTAAASAQGTMMQFATLNLNQTTLNQPSTPTSTLPPLQHRYHSFDRYIGNGWLGGSAHAYANILRQKQGTYELGSASVEFRGRGKLLQQSMEVAEIYGTATNVMNNGVQNRSGLFRIELLGNSIVNSSFVNSSTFAAENSTYNLFPGNGLSVSVPVGPISVTVRGNVGCGFGRSANWLLPAATASVGLNATANAYGIATASASAGVPGANIGVGIQGRILEQTLGGSVGASANGGLSGHLTYTLQAISLRLFVWATLGWWTWDTDLINWSSALVTLNLV